MTMTFMFPMNGYAVTVVNNDGGAFWLCATLEDVRERILAYSRDGKPGPTATEYETMHRDLDALGTMTDCVESVKGSDAWREWFYVAPLSRAFNIGDLSEDGFGNIKPGICSLRWD